jgi:hypothetical protein
MKTDLLKKILVWSCFMLAPMYAWASEGIPANTQSNFPLAQYIQILEDKNGTASIEDIQNNEGQFFSPRLSSLRLR